MAMEKTGVTEQDIADALTGKNENKQAGEKTLAGIVPPRSIGDDPMSKLAQHAKTAVAKAEKAV